MKRLFFLLILLSLLSGCETMRSGSLAPTPGSPERELYDDAQQGEREEIAGYVMLPFWVVATPLSALIAWGVPFDQEIWYPLFALSAGMLVSSVVLLIDGKIKVHRWNALCAGDSPAARYCLEFPEKPAGSAAH